MATFKRPPTWGEGLYPASWGIANMTWGGCWMTISELRHFGSIQIDISPSANIEFDLTPSVAIKLDLTPTAVIQEK